VQRVIVMFIDQEFSWSEELNAYFILLFW